MEVAALCVIAGTLGAMLFFAIGVAPSVFQSLPPERAGLFCDNCSRVTTSA